MDDVKLTSTEKEILLNLARRALVRCVASEPLEPLDFETLPTSLQEDGASFVTLTIRGKLRGCIGALEPYQSLAEDVRKHAVAAATQDYRFSPVNSTELPAISIEISRLTKPKLLVYEDASDLLAKLRPGIDGVVLRDGSKMATFLPQVWEKLPGPREFLNRLCNKMGVSEKTWQTQKLEVLVYQVEEFDERNILRKRF